MLEKTIPYKSIIMRCDSVRTSAFRKVSSGMSIEKYHSKMKSVWVEIQKAVGQFEGYSDAEILDYFDETFGLNYDEICDRCIFLKENVTGKYVGTCVAWFSEKEGAKIPVLHWLAVIPEYQNQGLARILITETLRIFLQKQENGAIYLHTQPSSFRAMKLYHDFGFNITKEDYYGHAVNEYFEAVKILEEIMEPEVYKELKASAVK